MELQGPQGCDDVASIYESIVREPTGVSLRYQYVFREDRELKQIAVSGQPNPSGGGFLTGYASQSRPWQNELSLKSRLRSMEHVKEHSHAEPNQRIDERREQRYRRNQTPQEIEEVEDERPH